MIEYFFNADKFSQRLKEEGVEIPAFIRDAVSSLHGKKVEEEYNEEYVLGFLRVVPGFRIAVYFKDCDEVETDPPKEVFSLERGDFRASLFNRGVCENHAPEDESHLWLVLERKNEQGVFGEFYCSRTNIAAWAKDYQMEREVGSLVEHLESALKNPMLMFDCYLQAQVADMSN